MRSLIVVAATLALAACGDQGADQNSANVSDAIAAEAIISNDTTAIDAATGDAANIAADVDYTVTNSNSGDVRADGSVDRRTTARRERANEAPASDGANGSAPTESSAETNEI